MAPEGASPCPLHAAPILFLLGPILSRLTPILPPLAIAGPEDFANFVYGVHLSNAVAVAVAVWLWRRAPRFGQPWLVAGGLVAAQSLLFETIGRTRFWETLVSAIASVPTSLIVSLGLAAASAVIWAGWNAGRAPPRAIATA